MKIFWSKNFHKQYKQLNLKNQDLVGKALELFLKDPFDAKLRNHSLKGLYKGCNSIDAAFDLRIIFQQEKNYFVVVLLQVGTHGQLY